MVVLHRQWRDFQRSSLSYESAHALEWLEAQARHTLTFTPSQADDDEFTISYAQQHRCPIVTNDNFNNHVARGIIDRRWAQRTLVKYAFLGDEWTPIMSARRALEEYARTGAMVG